ncbi:MULTISPECIES: heme o synthase [unclassified Beijerinckia]|uniref:heme o synthase n=1 Tax=unclassified Beijerinckia TaxID=2638183 RepID=UPI0008952349|nr:MULTISPECIES: heme o synthase [unclassified Beijerinckia]MDH7797785.1 protoheme IX farnesyltransferase [Beijerinckia sp. GAS462]SEC98510.1 protoheme IX farnesyltransferase [Beijerinckia sp. 28-YEA-48]
MSLVSDQNGFDPALVSLAGPGDYFALLKPRVMSLVVFTALAGLLIAPVKINPVLGFTALLAIAIGAGASGALNMWYDADIDAVMSRTKTRPIPSGRVQPGEALAFGLILSAFSVVLLGIATNWLAASLLAFTIFFYAVIYSMWLKRSTPQNIVIGGAAGAFPPVVAYAAATGSVSLSSVLLFAIIFIWTPPHFWALALVKSKDYAAAGVPMMPNVKGPDHTRLEILLYTILLAPLGVSPWFFGFASPVYGVIAAVAGLAMLALAVRVWLVRTGASADRAAMQLFGFSILYLFVLFAVVVVENCLARWGF